MADTAETRTPLGHDVSYRQAQMPAYSSATFVGNDTDYHALKVDARGKGKLTYGVDNATNKTATITLYGMHSATAEVGDTGVFAVASSGYTVTTATTAYKTNTDPFPWFLIRVKFADTPDGEAVTIYADFSAF